MKHIPKGLTRFAGRSLLKLNASSPTLLVVAGVVGLGATAVLAAKASRNAGPVMDQHKQDRASIGYVGTHKEQQREIVRLYGRTSLGLVRVYAAPIALGTLSAASVLYGHKILRGRHIASLAAYSGLMEQFSAYRGRVAKTLGDDMERSLYDGAHGEWKEDPNHKGEYKLEPVVDPNAQLPTYLRPWFEEGNPNWRPDPIANFLFLQGVQGHMNDLLGIRGHVTLNDVLDILKLPRCDEGLVAGWVYDPKVTDPKKNYVDFGFMTGQDPNTLAFRQGQTAEVQLSFNIDGNIYGLIRDH